MERRTRRMMSGSVLSLALVGLAVDRLVLGGSFSGPVAAEATLASIAPVSAAGISGAPAEVVIGIAQRLRDAAGLFPACGEANDPMLATPAWLVEGAPVAGEAAQERRRGARGTPRVTAVMVGRETGEGGAVIDGRFVRPGESMGGWVLEAIDASGVVLRRGSERLEVPTPGRSGQMP